MVFFEYYLLSQISLIYQVLLRHLYVKTLVFVTRQKVSLESLNKLKNIHIQQIMKLVFI